MKTKLDIIESLKKEFVDLLTGCTISFNGDAIENVDYRKDGRLVCFYCKREKIFGFSHDIWSNFESKYAFRDVINYSDFMDMVSGVVEEVLGYKGVTPYTLRKLLNSPNCMRE